MTLFRKLHLWLSVPFGLIITGICFTGAILVFEKEITEWSNRDLYNVKSIGETFIPLDELMPLVAEQVSPDRQIIGVTISNDPGRTYQVHLSQPQRASIYVDQYTGEVKGQGERLHFFTTVFRLHRWLMGNPRTEDGKMGMGKLIVGISTLMFVFVLLSGIVIWWPRNIKMLKNRLSIQWNKGRKRFYYDLHVVGGIYAIVVLLALSLTGLTWSFPWYKKGFYGLFGAEVMEKPRTKNSNPTDKNRIKGMDFAQWQPVYDKLVEQNPSFSKVMISDGTAQLYPDEWGNQRAADSYKFLPTTGEIIDCTPYSKTDKSKKIGGWIYSIHVGIWGGMFSRILTFLAALLGGSLPLTGYYLWMKRHWRLLRKDSAKCRIDEK